MPSHTKTLGIFFPIAKPTNAAEIGATPVNRPARAAPSSLTVKYQSKKATAVTIKAK